MFLSWEQIVARIQLAYEADGGSWYRHSWQAQGQVIAKEVLLGERGGSFYVRQLLLFFICYHVSDSRFNKQM